MGPSGSGKSTLLHCPARQCSSVDLPDPDGPLIAVNRPARHSTVPSSGAVTAVPAVPYTLTACSARTAALVLVCVVLMPRWSVLAPVRVVGQARAPALPRSRYQPAQPGRTSPAS